METTIIFGIIICIVFVLVIALLGSNASDDESEDLTRFIEDQEAEISRLDEIDQYK